MPRDYASMTTLVTQKLQSAGTADFSVSEVDNQIEDCLKEFAVYRPHLVAVTFKLESRTGTDVTGTASKLTDSVKAQFLAADATDEKVVHNITDNTWAVVLAQDSTSILSLSSDIMDANEKYEIFNKRCRSKKQIYIGDIVDYPEIESVEYPIGTKRNWRVYGDVLEIDIEAVPDSNSTLTTLSDIDVLVTFRRPHIVSQLTDWAGKMSATAAAAATSISLTSLQSTGTIEVGEELWIENHRTLYWIVASAEIAANTAAVSIYPPLEAAIASTVWTVAFRKTSLMPQEEDIFADLVAARLAINKAPLTIRGTTAAISVLATASTALSNMSAQILAATVQVAAGTVAAANVSALILTAATALAKVDAQIAAATVLAAAGTAEAVKSVAIILSAATAIAKIDAQVAAATVLVAAGTVEVAKSVAIILSAATAIAKVDAQVAAATASITSGTAYITTINVGENVPGLYAQYATGDVNNGMGYLNEGQGYLQQAREDENLAATYGGLAGGSLANAVQYLNEGQGYLQQAREDENLALTYGNLAGRSLANAVQYLNEAGGYFQQARANESLVNTHGGLATRSLANAAQYFSQATGYMRRIQSELSIAGTWRHYQEWGERKLAQVLGRLKAQTPPKTKRRYPTA